MAPPSMAPISGRIEGIHLSSFLQMLEMEKKTCIINVLSPGHNGQIFFHDGSVINAFATGKTGVDALYAILSWNDFKLEITPNKRRLQNQINLPLMHIIMESARLQDEAQTGDTIPQPVQAVFESKIPLQTLKSRNFCLEIGVGLLIEFDDIDTSFRSRLVGIEHDKYLLLRAPSPFEDFDRYRTKFGELIIKALYKGTIYAFRSTLMAIISKPSKLMFLEYPDAIEHHELRAHKRFKCNIAAQARINDTEQETVIENISKGGCRCTVQSLTFDPEYSAELLHQTLALKCRFPGNDKEIQLTGEVKNKHETTDRVAVGIEFVYKDKTDHTRDAINDFIKLIEYSGYDV